MILLVRSLSRIRRDKALPALTQPGPPRLGLSGSH
jgi:hypothetical protein